jgi:acetolactate decarboxylase
MWQVALAVVTIDCTPSSPAKGSATAADPHRADAEAVRVWGSLRSVMHEGNTDARVALSTVVPGPHAYAVGALSGLRGEVTIFDDEVVMSFGQGTGVARTASDPGQESATLLVRAVVPRWTSSAVERSIGPEEIDEQLEALATAAGMDAKTRIPVFIEGTAKELQWHVMSRQSEAGQHAHHGPRATGRLSATKVRLVGFFSRNDEGVFTHMGERTHFHVITTAPDRMTGHVDGFEMEPGAVVHFPAR